MPQRAFQSEQLFLHCLIAAVPTFSFHGPAHADEAGVKLYEKRRGYGRRWSTLGECARTRRQGGLQVDSVAAMLRGGDQGPARHARRSRRQPVDSRRSLRHQLSMPPKGKMPPEAVAALEEWVRGGAPGSGVGAKDARRGGREEV